MALLISLQLHGTEASSRSPFFFSVTRSQLNSCAEGLTTQRSMYGSDRQRMYNKIVVESSRPAYVNDMDRYFPLLDLGQFRFLSYAFFQLCGALRSFAGRRELGPFPAKP